MQVFVSKNEHETEAVGEKLGEKLPGGTVIAMYGDLGAGKTAFVRGLARGMGIDCRVSSPTFTIVNEYLGERELIHFDMYRLSAADSPKIRPTDRIQPVITPSTQPGRTTVRITRHLPAPRPNAPSR